MYVCFIQSTYKQQQYAAPQTEAFKFNDSESSHADADAAMSTCTTIVLLLL